MKEALTELYGDQFAESDKQEDQENGADSDSDENGQDFMEAEEQG